MSDNIKVAIKVRPLIKREQDEKLPIQWIVEENAMVRIDPETKKRGDAKFQFGELNLKYLFSESHRISFEMKINLFITSILLFHTFNYSLFIYNFFSRINLINSYFYA